MTEPRQLWTETQRAEYWKSSACHYADKVAEVQHALRSWRRDPETCIRRIATIVGYYIASDRGDP